MSIHVDVPVGNWEMSDGFCTGDSVSAREMNKNSSNFNSSGRANSHINSKPAIDIEQSMCPSMHQSILPSSSICQSVSSHPSMHASAPLSQVHVHTSKFWGALLPIKSSQQEVENEEQATCMDFQVEPVP